MDKLSSLLIKNYQEGDYRGNAHYVVNNKILLFTPVLAPFQLANDHAQLLSTVDRIERALALFMIVAWRIAYLMRMARTCPELDAMLFFDSDETHLARKGDGEPAAKTIWKGLQKVMTAAETLRALRH